MKQKFQKGMLGLLACMATGGAYADYQPVRPGFHLFGETLFWKTNIALPFAATAKDFAVSDGSIFFSNFSVENINPNYDVGVRLGAGYTFDCENLDVSFVWTQFKQKARRALQADPSLTILLVWDQFVSTSEVDNVQAELCEKMQTFDAVIGKTFLSSCRGMLRYYFGCKGASLKESQLINSAGISFSGDPTTSSGTLFNSFRAFGLMTGFNAELNVFERVSLYGRTEIAVLKSKLRSGEAFDEVVAGSPRSSMNESLYNSLKLNLVLEAGINFDISFCDRVGTVLNLGYEFNYWPNQINIVRPIVPGSPGSIVLPPVISDIGFQGFNLGLNLYF
ncbi:hypothetical protein HYX58_01525 [Candidatus Dependentiae bacterium]|nr:hypothetical protein [Candidatus Dependentiae bacterium]